MLKSSQSGVELNPLEPEQTGLVDVEAPEGAEDGELILTTIIFANWGVAAPSRNGAAVKRKSFLEEKKKVLLMRANKIPAHAQNVEKVEARVEEIETIQFCLRLLFHNRWTKHLGPDSQHFCFFVTYVWDQ